ncbi:flagellin [Kaarinaea lacus]
MAIKIDAHPSGNGIRANKSNTSAQTNIERLSSGKRINSAKDDAARLAIAMRFLNQIGGSQQAYRNVNDGVSMAQTGEAAMLQEEISRATSNTQFNGISLLDNSSTFEFQVGADSGEKVAFNTLDVASQIDAQGINNVDLSSAAGASNAINIADNVLDSLNQARGDYGASINRFESAGRNLLNLAENLQASRSRLEDADYTQQTAHLTRNLILQHAENAMRGQANVASQNVLQLLAN